MNSNLVNPVNPVKKSVFIRVHPWFFFGSFP